MRRVVRIGPRDPRMREVWWGEERVVAGRPVALAPTYPVCYKVSHTYPTILTGQLGFRLVRARKEEW